MTDVPTHCSCSRVSIVAEEALGIRRVFAALAGLTRANLMLMLYFPRSAVEERRVDSAVRIMPLRAALCFTFRGKPGRLATCFKHESLKDWLLTHNPALA